MGRSEKENAATARRRRAAQSSEQSERTSRQDSAVSVSVVGRFPLEGGR
jgi:hypothetical protein